MEGEAEESPISLEKTIEQTPFENPAVQSFFTEWCKRNDGIRPEYIEREEWEKREGSDKFLEPQDDGKQTLFVPRDLKLWEMVDVMEAVDTDTFSQNPQRRTEKREELRKLGEMFEHAGIYIAQRLDAIEQGKPIAEKLATEFYNYGFSLAQGEKPETALGVEEIKGFSIPDEELDNVDKWLAGEDFYRKKRDKFEKLHADDPDKGQLWEEERRKTLGQFFRVTEKAYEQQEKELKKADLPPWESDEPVHSAFLDKTNVNLRHAVEKPKSELYGSVFRRAMEALNRKMPFDKLPDSIKEDYQLMQANEGTLREALDIDDLRAKMDEIRLSGDIEKLVKWEAGVAKMVSEIVSGFPRTQTDQDISGDKAAEIIETQKINCVGASLLGGEILSELGMNYLVVSRPGHSILFLTTSDNRLVYLDMLNPNQIHYISDKKFSGERDGKPLTVDDLVNFAKDSDQQGMTFSLTSDIYIPIMGGDSKSPINVSVYKPDYGHQIQVLANNGLVFKRAHLYEEAVESFREVLLYDPENSGILGELGNALFETGKKEESIQTLQKAINLDPQNFELQKILCILYADSGRLEEAVETAKHAFAINSKNALLYFTAADCCGQLERIDEAKEYFEKFIELAEPQGETYAAMLSFAKDVVSNIDSFKTEPAPSE